MIKEQLGDMEKEQLTEAQRALLDRLLNSDREDIPKDTPGRLPESVARWAQAVCTFRRAENGRDRCFSAPQFFGPWYVIALGPECLDEAAVAREVARGWDKSLGTEDDVSDPDFLIEMWEFAPWDLRREIIVDWREREEDENEEGKPEDVYYACLTIDSPKSQDGGLVLHVETDGCEGDFLPWEQVLDAEGQPTSAGELVWDWSQQPDLRKYEIEAAERFCGQKPPSSDRPVEKGKVRQRK